MDVTDFGSVFPGWVITREIGQGAYGKVYRAEKTVDGKTEYSAVKHIAVPLNDSETHSLHAEGLDKDSIQSYYASLVDRFQREITAMETLSDVPNIVRIEEHRLVERENGVGFDVFIRMEYLIPLSATLTKGALDEEHIVKLAKQMCSALMICHSRGIIHRDIKTENIFIDETGNYKLGDFGIARRIDDVSGTLSMIGTKNYMPPEVAAGAKYDHRADIYSLGLTLYKLANGGRMPFLPGEAQLIDPAERAEALEKRLRGEKLPPPGGVSDKTAGVILRACEYKAHNRFENASEMYDALSNSATVIARSRILKIASKVAALALITIIAVSGSGIDPISDENDRSFRAADYLLSNTKGDGDVKSVLAADDEPAASEAVVRASDLKSGDSFVKTDNTSVDRMTAESAAPESDGELVGEEENNKTGSGGNEKSDRYTVSSDTKVTTAQGEASSEVTAPIPMGSEDVSHDNKEKTDKVYSVSLPASLYSGTVMKVIGDYSPNAAKIRDNSTDISYSVFIDDGAEELFVKEGLRSTLNKSIIGDNLKRVYFPSSLEYITSFAFGDRDMSLCPSLTDIYFNGSRAKWSMIAGNSVFSDRKITVHTLGDSDGVRLSPVSAFCSPFSDHSLGSMFDGDHSTSFGLKAESPDSSDHSKNLYFSDKDCFLGFSFDSVSAVDKLCLIWNDEIVRSGRDMGASYNVFDFSVEYTEDGERWKELKYGFEDVNLQNSDEFDPYSRRISFDKVYCKGIRLVFSRLPAVSFDRVSIYEIGAYCFS